MVVKKKDYSENIAKLEIDVERQNRVADFGHKKSRYKLGQFSSNYDDLSHYDPKESRERNAGLANGLLKKGKVIQAAQIYEMIGKEDKAINILLKEARENPKYAQQCLSKIRRIEKERASQKNLSSKLGVLVASAIGGLGIGFIVSSTMRNTILMSPGTGLMNIPLTTGVTLAIGGIIGSYYYFRK